MIAQYLRSAGEHTSCEIAAALNLPINTVTPRVRELRTQGLVLAAKRQCKITGRTAWAWKAKHPVLPPAFPEKAVGKVDANGVHFHNPTLFP